MTQSSDERRPEITIREIEIDDFPALFHLGEELFTSEDAPTLYRTWDEWEITNYFNMDSRFCLVADEEGSGQIVGFALASTVEKTGTAWKYGYLAWLGIRSGFQRRRLGRRLYEAMERRMAEDGIRIIMLDTDSENTPALAFFKRLGFEKSATHIWMAKGVRRRVRSRPPVMTRKGSPPPPLVAPPVVPEKEFGT